MRLETIECDGRRVFLLMEWMWLKSQPFHIGAQRNSFINIYSCVEEFLRKIDPAMFKCYKQFHFKCTYISCYIILFKYFSDTFVYFTKYEDEIHCNFKNEVQRGL